MRSLAEMISYIIGIFGVLGGAAAYFYKGRADSVITLYSKEVELLRADNDRLEKEQKDHLQQINELRADVKRLTAMVTQAPSIEKLILQQEQNHREILDALADILKVNNGGAHV